MASKEERKAQAAVLRLNFPVSSGMQHRAREWVPVTTGSATSTAASATQATAEPDREVCSALIVILQHRWIVVVSVVLCVLIKQMSPAKMAEPIEIPFLVQTCFVPMNYVLDGVHMVNMVEQFTLIGDAGC